METPNKHFAALRAQARDRRDKATAKIIEEYHASLSQINELERRLCGPADPTRLSVSAAVERVLPVGEPFSVADIIAALEGLDPSRLWRKTSVCRHITWLRNRGLVRRVKRHTVKSGAVYMRTSANEPGIVTEEKTVRALIDEVMTKPMRIAEVCAAVLAAGHKTSMIPGHFRTHVIRRLKEAGFRERDGKWGRN